MYILLSGIPPFNGKDDAIILKKIQAGTYSLEKKQLRHVSDQAKDLIKLMLRYSPDTRPTAKECLTHPWFQIEDLSGKGEPDPSVMSEFRQFYYTSRLERALYYFMVHTFATNEDHEKLMEEFKKLDSNGDGTLSKEEIKNGYKALQGTISVAEFEDLWESVDVNENGCVNYSGEILEAIWRLFGSLLLFFEVYWPFCIFVDND